MPDPADRHLPGPVVSSGWHVRDDLEGLSSKYLCDEMLLSCVAMRLEPANIQQIGDELAIAWNDGTESYLNLERLRRSCPCAGCGGEPDVLGYVSRPRVSYTERSFQLLGFDLVGGYALQPRWADGHNSGIYSFTYLRRLGQDSA